MTVGFLGCSGLITGTLSSEEQKKAVEVRMLCCERRGLHLATTGFEDRRGVPHRECWHLLLEKVPKEPQEDRSPAVTLA